MIVCLKSELTYGETCHLYVLDVKQKKCILLIGHILSSTTSIALVFDDNHIYWLSYKT